MGLVYAANSTYLPTNLGYHSSMALRYAEMWEERAISVNISNGRYLFEGGGSFQNNTSPGVAFSKAHKQEECANLTYFCDLARQNAWPDTPSFAYFHQLGIRQVTCDFAMAQCFRDLGDLSAAKLYFSKAGGASALNDGSEEAVPRGSTLYSERIADAAAALGAMYDSAVHNSDLLPTVAPRKPTQLSQIWYEQALKLGWEAPQAKCVYGHTHNSSKIGPQVEVTGPASWNGKCHSTWKKCDSMNRAIVGAKLTTGENIFNVPLFPAGSKCTAICIGAETSLDSNIDAGGNIDADVNLLTSDFTCGTDGIWKGELLCPDSLGSTPSDMNTSTFGLASTSPRSTWRADKHSILQPRWQLSAIKANGSYHESSVKCEWVDTRAARGRYVWVNFAPVDYVRNNTGELDSKFDVADAPSVAVYRTTYTNMDSVVEYEELYVLK
jgi:hypothetical protein